MKKSIVIKGILACVFSNIIWGFGAMVSKTALGYTAPINLLALRFLSAVVFLNLLLLTGKFKVSFRGKNLKMLLILATVEPVMCFLFNHLGLTHASSSFSGIMSSIVPVISLFASSIFLKETATIKQGILSFISIACIVIITLQSTSSGVTDWLGVLFLVLSCLSSVAYGILSRRLSGEFSAFERTYVMFTFSAIVFVICSIVQNFRQPLLIIEPLFHWEFDLLLVFMGGLSCVGAYILMNYAFTYIPVYRTTPFLNVTTITSIFAGVIFLHESITPLSYLCAAISILCLILIQTVAKGDAKEYHVKAKIDAEP